MLSITRSKLDSREHISSVQKCFDHSHSSLISKSIRLSVKNFIFKPINAIVLLIIFTFSVILCNYFKHYSLFGLLFVSLIGYYAIVIAYISYRSYFGWKAFIKSVVTESDISFKWANQVYSKEKNALFIANKTNSNELVIASAALLIGEEKNSKIIIGPEIELLELSENQGLLTHVGVLPKYFGNGYGKAIVKACIEFAKSKNVKTIKLCTSSSQLEAISLYKSLGFKITVVKELIPLLGFKVMAMELIL